MRRTWTLQRSEVTLTDLPEERRQRIERYISDLTDRIGGRWDVIRVAVTRTILIGHPDSGRSYIRLTLADRTLLHPTRRVFTYLDHPERVKVQ